MKILLLCGHRLTLRNMVASGLAAKLPGEVTVVAPLADWKDIPAEIRKSLRFCPLGGLGGGWLRGKLRRQFRLASLVAREHTNSTYAHKVAHEGRSRTKVMLWRFIRRFTDPERLVRQIEGFLPARFKASSAMDSICPDLILWVTTMAMDNQEIELIKVAKARKIPIVGIPASWDNLTSKGFWLIKPDSLFVWGDASKEQAIRSHGFSPEQIIVTGPPHF